MFKRNFIKIFFLFFFLIFLIFIYSKSQYNKSTSQNELTRTPEEKVHLSNIIKDVRHASKDNNGNEYLVEAEEGEIDLDNSNIIFLKNVKSNIKLANSDIITITSDFGKYNTNTYDSIFSNNVIINYLENKITGEYLDLSLINNLMIISNNIVYSNRTNVLKADVAEINTETKDIKIFMYENYKKVNIKNN